VTKPLKIALLVDRFGRQFGGAEAYSVDLVEQLSARHQVTVIAHAFDHQSDLANDQALPITKIKLTGPRWWPSWFRVWCFAMRAKALTSQGFDVVHSNMDGPAGDIQVVHVSPYRFRRLCGLSAWRRVLRWLSVRNAVYFYLEASRLKSQPGRHLVVVAPLLCDQLRATYPLAPEVTVIPPGVKAQTPKPGLRQKTRQALGIGDEDFICLLVARNPLRKGLVLLMQAIAGLPNLYKVLVVGAEPNIQAQITQRDPRYAERLLSVPPTENVSPYYFAADLCVHPTLGDSFGMAPLEAMAHGLAVVLSGPDLCGFAHYVKHGHDALVLRDARNVDEIRQAILKLSEGALRKEFIAHSASLVEALSWTNIAAQYEALYEKSISERKALNPVVAA